MTSLILEAPVPARRTFWEPWFAAAVAAALYLRVGSGEWGGLVALAAELALCLIMRTRLHRRAADEIELIRSVPDGGLPVADADRMITGIGDRLQAMFATASSAMLAVGMAASVFLLLFYSKAGATGSGIASVAPKAFVATGYAILCALALTRDAHRLTSTAIEPLRRRAVERVRNEQTSAADAEEEPQSEHAPSRLEQLIEQLVAMHLSQLEALTETNRLLATSAAERVDEESGTVRAKLSKGLTDFRKSVEQLNGIVQSLNARLDGLTREESVLFERHRRELIGEIARLPQQVVDRTAGIVAGSVIQVEERFKATLQTIHDEESRRARDLLAGEFTALRDQFELTERSVSAIAVRFNEVISSLDALASAFDRSARSVVTSAGDFMREAESLALSVTETLARLETRDDGKLSLLKPLTEAATAVRKASSLMATDMRRVAAERERLGRVRLKLLDLLPKEQEG
jgi:hypothetical protein